MPKSKTSAVASPRRAVTELNLYCPIFGISDGYGNSCEKMAMGLERAGVSVNLRGIIPVAGATDAPEIIGRLRDGHSKICRDFIFYSTPQDWTARSAAEDWRHTVGFTMFEASTIPDTWIGPLQRVDEIWVPSQWCMEVFSKYAADKPVRLVPLGIDAKSFSYADRKRGDVLRFLHWATAGTEYRKGADVAIAAFKKAFPGREDVYLELRSSRLPYDKPTEDHRIQVQSGLLTTAQLADLYRSFDCLVYPSRGEGFGLIPLEAMATGLPTIYSGVTGMADFADEQGRNPGLTVKSRAVQCQIGEGRLYWQHTAGEWFECDLDCVVERMKEVDENYRAVQAQAARDAKYIASRFTWDKTAAIIKENLESWDGPSMRRPEPVGPLPTKHTHADYMTCGKFCPMFAYEASKIKAVA